MTLKTPSSNCLNIFIDKCSFGRGVFAAKNIAKGEVILTFSGRTITLDEALAKGETSGNPLQIDTKTYVDIEEPGVIVNHHCNPNAGIINTYTLVALIDICKGEEIFYDYSTTMSENSWSENSWTMECGCSATNCRKIVKDFHYLPLSIKQKYLELGIVQKFIVIEHELMSKINFNN